ncbi:MBL fold metallo-hydrolase [Providencia hangzhouensis]|uniref:Arsenate reductase and related proteins, glutaredoxin family n=1 Tax=Providencia rettgeri TaxID=587 RepID=A0A9N8D3B0_PRORE|nr:MULTISPECIES: MBL fold metallo-hydrolase [Providencia]MBQ0265631.1 MBL fold metallo-hydrolase [Providencia rettgeri]MBQ0370107.1 MBL fold metallo-hydrolase [Providencia rettgeri]MBT0661188.1 MBL fold metallo-hydrolase [Providencia rettgeri]MCB4857198.1 MBL fold metallo-hydrolase [Providencia rettgeri]MCD6315424.1 MBL fold metallo-hydrolase [Providencia rettgeri]
MKLTLLAATALFATTINLAQAETLTLDVYNPGNNSVFPVSSEIISGSSEVVLIDAQFQKNDAQQLVDKIKKLNKKLTTIYISHSDPDYYFGLDTLTSAFPEAKVIATANTVDAIKATKDGKLAYWGGVLKDEAPTHVIVPEVIKGDYFTVDGEKLEIKGLDGVSPDRTYLWVPSLKAVVGGVIVSDNIHVWVADTQTEESRKNWLQTLKDIKALNPATVVPGHFTGASKLDVTTVSFTQKYLQDFESAYKTSKNSGELIQKVAAKYPQLDDKSSLELSAKVIKGEMKWPQ